MGACGVVISDVTGNEPQHAFGLSPHDGYRSVAMSPDGKKFAVGGDRLELRDAKDFKILRQWALPGGTHPSFTPDGRHLITCNANGTIYVLRLEEQN